VSGDRNAIESGTWSVTKKEKWNALNENVRESVFVETGTGKTGCGKENACTKTVSVSGRAERGKRIDNGCTKKNERKKEKGKDAERSRNRRRRVMMMTGGIIIGIEAQRTMKNESAVIENMKKIWLTAFENKKRQLGLRLLNVTNQALYTQLLLLTRMIWMLTKNSLHQLLMLRNRRFCLPHLFTSLYQCLVVIQKKRWNLVSIITHVFAFSCEVDLGFKPHGIRSLCG
jgi:hypothetical protein